MHAEFDYDLTPDQWETLKAIRVPVLSGRALNRSILENLVNVGTQLARDRVHDCELLFDPERVNVISHRSDQALTKDRPI